jgi:hypothetical protein
MRAPNCSDVNPGAPSNITVPASTKRFVARQNGDNESTSMVVVVVVVVLVVGFGVGGVV